MATTAEGVLARERVIDALIDIVADEGFEAVSVRTVAARAGVTGGMVQHHFPTKRSMLLTAARAVSARVATTITAVRDDLPPDQALHRVALLLVPLDATRSTEGRVWVAFLARAAVDPDLAAEHRRTWSSLEAFLATLVAAAHSRPAAEPADRDAAALLLATLDGLAVSGLVEGRRLGRARMRKLVGMAVAAAVSAAA